MEAVEVIALRFRSSPTPPSYCPTRENIMATRNDLQLSSFSNHYMSSVPCNIPPNPQNAIEKSGGTIVKAMVENAIAQSHQLASKHDYSTTLNSTQSGGISIDLYCKLNKIVVECLCSRVRIDDTKHVYEVLNDKVVHCHTAQEAFGRLILVAVFVHPQEHLELVQIFTKLIEEVVHSRKELTHQTQTNASLEWHEEPENERIVDADEMKALIASLENQLVIAQESNRRVIEENTAMEELIKQLKDDNATKEVDISSKNKEIFRIKDTLGRIVQDTEVILDERNKLLTKVATYKAQLHSYENATIRAKKAAKNCQNELKEKEKTIAKLHDTVAHLQTRISHLEKKPKRSSIYRFEMFGNSFYPPSSSPFNNSTYASPAVSAVSRMAQDPNAKKWAKDNGLDIMNVSWEDSARYKNSCWGPCISDMTLVVENTWMPVMRVPNFSDPIMSIATNKINVTVGNESPHTTIPLTKITLQEYLENIHKYTELENNMYTPLRDHQALVSTQACFLPIENNSSKVDFHVGLHSYQSTPDDPAVLVLVCTDSGTSAQVVGKRGDILYSNNHGTKHTFVAERLSTDRAKRGIVSTGAMTTEEEARNYIMIVQIPLHQKPKGFSFGSQPQSSLFGSSQFGGQPVAFGSSTSRSFAFSSQTDVEAATISLGDAKGPFPKLSQFSKKQRDSQYPIRVTIQFYQATSNGVVSPEIIQDLASKMDQVKTNASWWGSLVTTTFPTPRQPFAPSASPFMNPHEGVVCDECNQAITTTRYKCLCCPNYDICANCDALNTHNHPRQHPLIRLNTTVAAYGPKNYAVQNRSELAHKYHCSTCSKQIIGVLYQCTQCLDVRLCEACELITGHADFQHPLLKVFHSK